MSLRGAPARGSAQRHQALAEIGRMPGADLVEWFAQWRERAKVALARVGEPGSGKNLGQGLPVPG